MPLTIPAVPGSHASWTGQYVVSEDPAETDGGGPPLGWVRDRIGPLHVVRHRSLPLVPVLRGGAEVGAVLGWPVLDGAPLDRVEAEGGPVDAALDRLAGRWLYVGPDRVRPDPGASQPAVYSRELRAFASSPGLLPARPHDSLIEAYDVERTGAYFQFGLTPLHGVRRLMPNHELDFGSFEARRVHAGPAPGTVSLRDAAEVVAEVIEQTARALAPVGLQIGLTAGRDSRTALACVRGVPGIQFFTGFVKGRPQSRIDLQVATALARRAGLRHEVRPFSTDYSEADLDAFRRAFSQRVGGVLAGHAWKSAQPVSGASPFSFHGGLNAVGKGQFTDADAGCPLTGRAAVDLLRSPDHPAVAEAAEAWAAGLPDPEGDRHLILLYLEQRVGCWASPAHLARPEYVRLYPQCRRDAVDAMLGLSPEDRAARALPTAVIEHGWPELLALPFNKPLGVAAVAGHLRRVAKRLLRTG